MRLLRVSEKEVWAIVDLMMMMIVINVVKATLTLVLIVTNIISVEMAMIIIVKIVMMIIFGQIVIIVVILETARCRSKLISTVMTTR